MSKAKHLMLRIDLTRLWYHTMSSLAVICRPWQYDLVFDHDSSSHLQMILMVFSESSRYYSECTKDTKSTLVRDIISFFRGLSDSKSAEMSSDCRSTARNKQYRNTDRRRSIIESATLKHSDTELNYSMQQNKPSLVYTDFCEARMDPIGVCTYVQRMIMIMTISVLCGNSLEV